MGRELDDENPEWTADDFRRARPTTEALGEAVAAALTRRPGELSKWVALQHRWLTRDALAA